MFNICIHLRHKWCLIRLLLLLLYFFNFILLFLCSSIKKPSANIERRVKNVDRMKENRLHALARFFPLDITSTFYLTLKIYRFLDGVCTKYEWGENIEFFPYGSNYSYYYLTMKTSVFFPRYIRATFKYFTYTLIAHTLTKWRGKVMHNYYNNTYALFCCC